MRWETFTKRVMTLRIDPLPGDEDRPGQFRGRKADCLRIALINNMRGPAFLATERQFQSLLRTASDEIPVRISRYVLEEESGADREGAHDYKRVDDLWNDHPDGII